MCFRGADATQIGHSDLSVIDDHAVQSGNGENHSVRKLKRLQLDFTALLALAVDRLPQAEQLRAEPDDDNSLHGSMLQMVILARALSH